MALKFLLLISRALPSSRRIMQAWGVSGYIISQFWDLLSHLPKKVKKQQQKWNKIWSFPFGFFLTALVESLSGKQSKILTKMKFW